MYLGLPRRFIGLGGGGERSGKLGFDGLLQLFILWSRL